VRREFQRKAPRKITQTAFAGAILRGSGARDFFVNGTDVDDLAGLLGREEPSAERTRTQKRARQIRLQRRLPFTQGQIDHGLSKCVDPRVTDENGRRSKCVLGRAEQLGDRRFVADIGAREFDDAGFGSIAALVFNASSS